MKYLVAVDDCFLDHPRGAARVAWDIALLMRGRGHDVTMIAIDDDAARPGPPSADHDGIRVLRYSRPVLPAWHPGRMKRSLAAATEATRRWLAGEAWDVVHIHSPFTGAGVAAALQDRTRYVYTLHSPIVAEQEINWRQQGWVGRVKRLLGAGAIRRLERDLLARSAAIHVLSQYSRSWVQHYHGLGDRVTIIPHWRRPELRRQYTQAQARGRLGWPESEPTLFTVRGLGPRYGIDVAIRAVAPLAAAKRCRFVIGGEGPLRAYLEQLARETGAGTGVHFAGRLSEEQLALMYQAADLFLLPTLALECFGLIIQEAFAFGCPVLSSDAGAIPELMRPILPDFIVPAGNVEALRGAATAFLDGRLVAPPSEQLVRYVDQNFSEAVIGPRIAQLVEGVAHRDR